MNALLAGTLASEAAPDAVEAKALDRIRLCGIVHWVAPKRQLLCAWKGQGTGWTHGLESCVLVVTGGSVGAPASCPRPLRGRTTGPAASRRAAWLTNPNLDQDAVRCFSPLEGLARRTTKTRGCREVFSAIKGL